MLNPLALFSTDSQMNQFSFNFLGIALDLDNALKMFAAHNDGLSNLIKGAGHFICYDVTPNDLERYQTKYDTQNEDNVVAIIKVAITDVLREGLDSNEIFDFSKEIIDFDGELDNQDSDDLDAIADSIEKRILKGETPSIGGTYVTRWKVTLKG